MIILQVGIMRSTFSAFSAYFCIIAFSRIFPHNFPSLSTAEFLTQMQIIGHSEFWCESVPLDSRIKMVVYLERKQQ